VHHTRVLRPAEGIYAFYDGRIEGYRYAEDTNWVDDGALSLGIASYAVVDGEEALVYDTHVSVEHGHFIRGVLEGDGVQRMTVVLSHRHLDHIAGTAAFDAAQVIAHERAAEELEAKREAIEAGTLAGPPGIDPLVLPTRTFGDRLSLRVGAIDAELIHVNIHSDDAAVLWLPAQRLLFAGDTLEDTLTYVAEPDGLETHLAELDRLARLDPERILPNHGDPDVIAAGGYPSGLITATQEYIRFLQRCRDEPQLRETDLREVLGGPLEAGWIRYFEPYEAVHRANLANV
jgi:cyclase